MDYVKRNSIFERLRRLRACGGINGTREGFTIIEIMAVVAVIAILAAIMIPTVTGFMRRARIKSTRMLLTNVEQFIQAFNVDVGAYPSSLADLKTAPADEKLARKWDGPYLTKDPVDAWNHELVYTLNPKGTKPPYELYSWGPNGEGSPEGEWIRAGGEE
jgi:general secretion pathway protein G